MKRRGGGGGGAGGGGGGGAKYATLICNPIYRTFDTASLADFHRYLRAFAASQREC